MTLYAVTANQILATHFPRSAPAGGEIYLIHSSNGLYKIGRSKHLWKRMRELESEVGEELDLIRWFWVHDAPATERMLHGFFHDKRVAGEWFALDQEELEVFFALSEIMEKRTSTIEERYVNATLEKNPHKDS